MGVWVSADNFGTLAHLLRHASLSVGTTPSLMLLIGDSNGRGRLLCSLKGQILVSSGLDIGRGDAAELQVLATCGRRCFVGR